MMETFPDVKQTVQPSIMTIGSLILRRNDSSLYESSQCTRLCFVHMGYDLRAGRQTSEDCHSLTRQQLLSRNVLNEPSEEHTLPSHDVIAADAYGPYDLWLHQPIQRTYFVITSGLTFIL